MVIGPKGLDAWFLVRWPLDGTVASTCIRHGHGGLNIEACRVAWGPDKPSQEYWNRIGSSGSAGANGYAGQFNITTKLAYANGKIPVPSGRWPPNVLLVHGPGCRLSGLTEISFSARYPLNRGHSWKFSGQHSGFDGQRDLPVVRFPSETVQFWSCESGCLVSLLVQQYVVKGHDQSSPVTRFFHQFGSMDNVRTWFERLIG
jgi:hypothetical protein